MPPIRLEIVLLLTQLNMDQQKEIRGSLGLEGNQRRELTLGYLPVSALLQIAPAAGNGQAMDYATFKQGLANPISTITMLHAQKPQHTCRYTLEVTPS
jgi:hypothetical protein